MFLQFFENISGFRRGTAPGTPHAATPLQALLDGPRFLQFFVKIFDNFVLIFQFLNNLLEFFGGNFAKKLEKLNCIYRRSGVYLPC